MNCDWHLILMDYSKLMPPDQVDHRHTQYPQPFFTPHPAINLCIFSSPITTSKIYLEVTYHSERHKFRFEGR